jgi:hypothetical protein
MVLTAFMLRFIIHGLDRILVQSGILGQQNGEMFDSDEIKQQSDPHPGVIWDGRSQAAMSLFNLIF